MAQKPSQIKARRQSICEGHIPKGVWVAKAIAGGELFCRLHRDSFKEEIKVEIKKFYVVSLASFALFISGYFVLEIIASALAESGWYGFGSLFVFIVSLIVVVKYFSDYKIKAETAKEAAQETVKEQLKENPDIFQRTSPEALKDQIETHLIKKVNEEKYVLWKKA